MMAKVSLQSTELHRHNIWAKHPWKRHAAKAHSLVIALKLCHNQDLCGLPNQYQSACFLEAIYTELILLSVGHPVQQSLPTLAPVANFFTLARKRLSPCLPEGMCLSCKWHFAFKPSHTLKAATVRIHICNEDGLEDRVASGTSYALRRHLTHATRKQLVWVKASA